MIAIQFIEYVAPDRKVRRVSVPIPDDLGTKVVAIMDQGFRFEIETLQAGILSATISDDGADYIGRIMPFENYLDGVEAMIREFDIGQALRVREINMEQDQ